jgi:hypothetical protein
VEDIARAEAAVIQCSRSTQITSSAIMCGGFLLRRQRQPDAARDAFRTVVALNPNFAPGYTHWA